MNPDRCKGVYDPRATPFDRVINRETYMVRACAESQWGEYKEGRGRMGRGEEKGLRESNVRERVGDAHFDVWVKGRIGREV